MALLIGCQMGDARASGQMLSASFADVNMLGGYGGAHDPNGGRSTGMGRVRAPGGRGAGGGRVV
jgi:hypothetical protein